MLFCGRGLKCFSPIRLTPILKQHINSSVIIIQLDNLKGTRKAPAEDLLRLNDLDVLFLTPKCYNEPPPPILFTWESPRAKVPLLPPKKNLQNFKSLLASL